MEESQAISERKNIRWGVILSYVRLGIFLVISLFYPPYLLSKIGEATNGLYQFALSIASYLLLCSLGIENSYIHFTTEQAKDYGKDGVSKTNGTYLVLFAAVSFLELIAGLLVALLYRLGLFSFSSDESQQSLLSLLLVIAVVSVSTDFFFSLFDWFVFYRGRFIYEQIIYLASHLFTVAGCVLALALGGDIVSVSLVTLAVQFLFDLVTLCYALFRLRMPFSFSNWADFKKDAKKILAFSIFIFFSIAVSQINASLGKTILGQMSDFTGVTIYSFGVMFYQYEGLIANAVATNFSPKINQFVFEKKDAEVKRLFLKVSTLQLLILCFIVGGYWACGESFSHLWLGSSGLAFDDIQQVYWVSAGFLLLWLIPFTQCLGIEIQRAYGQHKRLALINLSCAALNIFLSILLAWLLPTDLRIWAPFIGMAVAVVIGMIIASNFFYGRKLGLPMLAYWKNFGVIAGVASLSALIVEVVFRFGILFPADFPVWASFLIRGGSYTLIDLPFILIYLHFFTAKEKSSSGLSSFR